MGAACTRNQPIPPPAFPSPCRGSEGGYGWGLQGEMLKTPCFGLKN